MSRNAPEPKLMRISALCPAEMHREFMSLVDRMGESAGMILRALIHEAIDRAHPW